MAEKRDNVAVKYKDNVFCMLYRDKKNLLELYNALNNSNYINVNDLKVTTLNGGSYMKYKNDASFLLSMNLYMFEQHREEVVEVSIYDYDEDKVRKTLVDEAVEEIVGKVVDEAKKETTQLNMINLIIKKVKKEKTLETIASELEEDVEDIKVLYDIVKEEAPGYDVDKIMKKLNNEND